MFEVIHFAIRFITFFSYICKKNTKKKKEKQNTKRKKEIKNCF
jgi:phosphotransferase system  glucose/maltose/N-acetylglucosamine-specific IIC component